MIASKDGNVRATHAWRATCRAWFAGATRTAKVGLAVAVWVSLPLFAPDVVGAGRTPAAPAVWAIANGAMTLMEGRLDPPVAEQQHASANRPLRLPDREPSTPPSDKPELAGMAVTPEPATPTPADERDGPILASLTEPASLAASVGGLAMAQSRGDSGNTTPSGDGLIESVVLDRKQTERIRVARNVSAVINLRANVDGVDIADPTIADVYLSSPTRIVVTGRGFGTTQLLLRIGKEERAFHVDVELDLSQLEAFIKTVAPMADVVARSVNGTIYLNGSVPDARTAQQVADMAGLVQGGEIRSNLVVAGVQQTMIRVVVAEVNKMATRQLGINWAIGASSWSRDFLFANNLGQLNPTTFASSGVADITLGGIPGQNLYSVAPVGNGATTNVTFGFPRAEFQVFLNALRENNLARTLAEPNLVAISGQTASFLVGGEVPLSVVSSTGGSSTVSIYYKEFGIRLAFTPTVLGEQIVRMHVMTEVSEPVQSSATAGGLPVFSFETRRVETTIECGNGQTFAVAGLLSESVSAVASKIPGLGDLPILGTLFSSTSYQREETELIVLVTPQLVEPLDPQMVPPVPGSEMTVPTDAELFAMQKLEGTPEPRAESDRVPREAFPVKTHPGSLTTWPTSQLALRGPWGLAELEER